MSHDQIALFVQSDLDLHSVQKLSNIKLSVEESTGSHVTFAGPVQHYP